MYAICVVGSNSAFFAALESTEHAVPAATATRSSTSSPPPPVSPPPVDARHETRLEKKTPPHALMMRGVASAPARQPSALIVEVAAKMPTNLFEGGEGGRRQRGGRGGSASSA
jgi:hypothetical protein